MLKIQKICVVEDTNLWISSNVKNSKNLCSGGYKFMNFG